MMTESEIHWRVFAPVSVTITGPTSGPDGNRAWTAVCDQLPSLTAMADTPNAAARGVFGAIPSVTRTLSEHGALPAGLVRHVTTTATVGRPA